MRITSVHAIPISVPGPEIKSNLGTFTTFDFAIVRVSTDEGVEGLGEISTLWDGRHHVQCAFVNEHFGPLLIGEDPTALNRCLARMSTISEHAWPARAGVEMALHDVAGKALSTPAYNLLGGKTRESVLLSRSVHMDRPEVMAERATAYAEEGFACVKVKVGQGRDIDRAAVEAIRQAIGPDILLRVDANMAWRIARTAITAIRELEEFDLHSVEQPIPPGDNAALRFVRERVNVPIMADESVWGPSSAWRLLTDDAVDMLNVYVAESGGLRNAALIFSMAEVANVPCVIGAMPELGIGTAAAIHLGVAVNWLDSPCDAAGAMYHSNDLLVSKLRIENGRAWPPDAPGLGVQLDEEAFAKWRVG